MSNLELQMALATLKEGKNIEGLSLLLEARPSISTNDDFKLFEENLWAASRKVFDNFFAFFGNVQNFSQYNDWTGATIKLLKLIDFIYMFHNLDMQFQQDLFDKREKKDIQNMFFDFFSQFQKFLENEIKTTNRHVENILLFPFLIDELASELASQMGRLGFELLVEKFKFSNNSLIQDVMKKFHELLEKMISSEDYLMARRYFHICTDLYQRSKLKKYPFSPNLDKIQISIYLLQSNFEEKLALLEMEEKRYDKAIQHVVKAINDAESANDDKRCRALRERKDEIGIASAFDMIESVEKSFRLRNFPEIEDAFKRANEILIEVNQKKQINRGQKMIDDHVIKIVDFFLLKANPIEPVTMEYIDEKLFYLNEAYYFSNLGYDDKLKMRIQKLVNDTLEKKIPLYIDSSKKLSNIKEYEKAFTALMNAYDIAKSLRQESTMKSILKRFKPLNDKIPYDFRLKLEEGVRIEQDASREEAFKVKKKEYEEKIIMKDKPFIPNENVEEKITEIINKFESSRLLKDDEIAVLQKYSFNLPLQRRYYNPVQRVNYEFVLIRNLREQIVVCCVPSTKKEEDFQSLHVNMGALAYDFLFYIPAINKSANISQVMQDLLNFAINNNDFVLYKKIMKGTKYEFLVDYIIALANAFRSPEEIIITEQFLRNMDEKVDAMAFMNIFGMAIMAKKPFILSWDEKNPLTSEALFFALTVLSIINGKANPALVSSGLIDNLIHLKAHYHQAFE